MKTHTFKARDANGTKPRKYRVKLNEHVHGYSVVPSKKSDYEIYVDARLKGVRHLDICIHEALHAIFPQESEEWVSGASNQLSRWLWRIGYRKGV